MSTTAAPDPKAAIIYHACKCEANLRLADFIDKENAFSKGMAQSLRKIAAFHAADAFSSARHLHKKVSRTRFHGQLRGNYHNDWKPTSVECEQQIIVEWTKLCEAVDERGQESVQARRYTTALHDLGIIRKRAIAAAAAINLLRQHALRVLQP